MVTGAWLKNLKTLFSKLLFRHILILASWFVFTAEAYSEEHKNRGAAEGQSRGQR